MMNGEFRREQYMDQTYSILLYHGVSRRRFRGIENLSRKHIHTDDFERQLGYLAKHCQVLPLQELVSRAESNELERGTVAITFDDGFRNNYSDAYPLLSRYRMHATFFLSTGLIGTEEAFWVDKLEYLLNETTQSGIEVPSLSACFEVGEVEGKRQALMQIKRALKRGDALVADVVAEVVAASRVEPSYDYPEYRTMDWDQVREMHASGLCAFGAHTVGHTILSHLSRSEKAREIEGSLRKIEQEVDVPATLFSYPEGQASHFDDESIRVLRESGVTMSPTAMFGRNGPKTCPFHLKRNMVEFAAPFEACVEGSHADCG